MSKLFELQSAALKPKIPRKKSESRAKPNKPRSRFRVDPEPLEQSCLPANAVRVAELVWSFCSNTCFVAHEDANRYGLYIRAQPFIGEASIHRVATFWNYRLGSTEISAAMVEGYLRSLEKDENSPGLVHLCEESGG
jgi:hypothetical protein